MMYMSSREVSRDTRRAYFFATIQMKTNQTASGFPRSRYRNSFFLSFFFLGLDFLQTSVNLTGPKSGYMRLPET